MGTGLQKIPFRIPEQWSAAWYAQHIREVLALADARNAIGEGVQITGQPGEVATITLSEDIQNLLLQSFVLATPSAFLENERTLAGVDGITITDNGPDSTLELGIEDDSLTLAKLVELSNYGVLGNPVNAQGQVQNIQPDGDKSVLHVNGTAIEFAVIDHTWVSDFDEAAQDAVGTIFNDSPSIDLSYNDALGVISADVDESWSPTWTGDHIFTNGFALSSVQPEAFWVETDAAANGGVWGQLVAGGSLRISAFSDDLATEVAAITIARSTTTLSSISLGARVLNVSGTASLPGYGFASDLDSGIFLEAADTVSVAVGGSLIARFSPTTTAIVGAFRFASVINPPQITSNQNDYAPTGIATCVHARLETDASRNITGISRANLLGRHLYIYNVGSFDIVLKNLDGGSAAGNQFDIGADITIGPKKGAVLFDDVTASKWKCVARYV